MAHQEGGGGGAVVMGEARGGAGWGARAGRAIGERPGAVMLAFTIVAAVLGVVGMGVALLLSPLRYPPSAFFRTLGGGGGPFFGCFPSLFGQPGLAAFLPSLASGRQSPSAGPMTAAPPPPPPLLPMRGTRECPSIRTLAFSSGSDAGLRYQFWEISQW